MCVALPIMAAAGIACSSPAAGGGTPTLSIQDVTDSVGSVSLDESRAVVVSPYVTVDARGGFLVADAGEKEIRRYTSEGVLLWRNGRSDGLGSAFALPGQLIRNSSGDLLVLDAFGQVSRWDADGGQLLEALDLHLRPFYRVRVVNDSLLLIVGRTERSESHLLWLWNQNARRLERSFFQVPGNEVTRTVSMFAGMADARPYVDTIAAVSAFSDTIYLFSLSGAELRKIPMPLTGYRQLTSRPRPRMSPVEQKRWLASFSRILTLFRLTDGTFVVQYAQDSGGITRNHLLRMDAQGGKVFELRNVPRLLTVDGVIGYFQSPDLDEPHRWALRRFRPVAR